MTTALTRRSRRALTLIEVLVLIGVLAVLFALMPITPRRGAREKAQRVHCVSNLKQTSLSFILFAEGHEQKLPWNLPQQRGGSLEFSNYPQVFPHFLVASNELVTPKLLTCAADSERVRTDRFQSLGDSNLSYFVALSASESQTNGVLAGDRNLVGGAPPTAKLRTFTSASVVRWSNTIHKIGGNLAFVDGSAQRATSVRLQEVVRSNSVPTMRLAIP